MSCIRRQSLRGTRASSPVTGRRCANGPARSRSAARLPPWNPSGSPQPHRRARRPPRRADVGEPRRSPDPRGDGAGKFDDLPYQGEPLPVEDETYAGDMGDGLPHAAQRGRRAALDRGGQGGPGRCSRGVTRSSPAPGAAGSRVRAAARPAALERARGPGSTRRSPALNAERPDRTASIGVRSSSRTSSRGSTSSTADDGHDLTPAPSGCRTVRRAVARRRGRDPRGRRRRPGAPRTPTSSARSRRAVHRAGVHAGAGRAVGSTATTRSSPRARAATLGRRRVHRGLRGGDHAHIAAFYTRPDARGAGLGRRCWSGWSRRYPGLDISADVLSATSSASRSTWRAASSRATCSRRRSAARRSASAAGGSGPAHRPEVAEPRPIRTGNQPGLITKRTEARSTGPIAARADTLGPVPGLSRSDMSGD